uniref:Transposase n=1 Tax=Panagrellus redivivus TaxID=6233 RepID=A0A7E4W4D9_PANRE
MELYKTNPQANWAAMDITFSMININTPCQTNVFNRRNIKFMMAGEFFKLMIHFRSKLQCTPLGGHAKPRFASAFMK